MKLPALHDAITEPQPKASVEWIICWLPHYAVSVRDGDRQNRIKDRDSRPTNKLCAMSSRFSFLLAFNTSDVRLCVSQRVVNV